MRETDLFEPVRDYLQQQGFAVAAEVRHCDVAARKDDELVIIELKTSLNLTLVGQAVRRQSVADAVYVAIPEPKRITKTLKQSQRVLARLGLGLLTIRFGPLRTSVNCRLEPSYRGRLDRRERNRILKEMDGRSLQLNTGGMNNLPIVTAYREQAITLASILSIRGSCSVGELKPITGDKTTAILYKNHYGWFIREGRGRYALSPAGADALREYPELVALALPLAAHVDENKPA
ncbi:MAG: DUF2161 family putative PD-(D/E)XK-type phosphodiesterase [Pseudomonadales bacterium]